MIEVIIRLHDFLIEDIGDVEEASRNASSIQYDHCRNSFLSFLEDPNASDMQGNGWKVQPWAGEHMNSVIEHSGDSVCRHRDDYIMGEDVTVRHRNVFCDDG